MKEFLKLQGLYQEYLLWRKSKPKPSRKEYHRKRYLTMKEKLFKSI